MSAVYAEGVDAGVPAHYGDPMAEQRLLTERAGLVDRSNRGVVAVSGPDRLSWLHDITTQYLRELAPYQGTEILVLSPHGHVEHHAVAVDDGETLWLDTEPGRAPALLDFLEKMRFFARVELRDATDEMAVCSVVGPEAVAALGMELAEPDVIDVPGPKFPSGSVPARPTVRYAATASPDGGIARRMSYGVDLLVPRSQVARLVDHLGLPRAGIAAFEATRVVSGIPRLGLDTDHRTLPHEVGWIAPAVHLEKGCYRGQETVARVHNLGRPPRRLVLVHLDGVSEELPSPGSEVKLDGRTVGFLGTAVRHYEWGAIALAVVKRSVPDDARLMVGDTAVAIDSEPTRLVD